MQTLPFYNTAGAFIGFRNVQLIVSGGLVQYPPVVTDGKTSYRLMQVGFTYYQEMQLATISAAAPEHCAHLKAPDRV